MTSELIIGIGGVILSVLTYFAGVYRTERRHRANNRAVRIRRVSDEYMRLLRSNLTGGCDGLVKAGVATLASNAEVQELIGLIVAHSEKHPLGSDRDTVFQGVDLLKLFKYAAEKRVNLVMTRIEDVIRDSGAR